MDRITKPIVINDYILIICIYIYIHITTISIIEYIVSTRFVDRIGRPFVVYPVTWPRTGDSPVKLEKWPISRHNLQQFFMASWR